MKTVVCCGLPRYRLFELLSFLLGNSGGIAKQYAPVLKQAGAFFIFRKEMNMQEKLEQIRSEILAGIEGFDSSRALYEFRKVFLDNKEGKISQLMKGLKDVSKEDRPAVGKAINEVKEWALNLFEETDKKIHKLELEKKNDLTGVDLEALGLVKEDSLKTVEIITDKDETAEYFEVSEEDTGVIATVMNALSRNYREYWNIFFGKE